MKSLFEGLPSLHPLLVHFPIVLLLMALISHIGALLLKKHRRPFTVLTFDCYYWEHLELLLQFRPQPIFQAMQMKRPSRFLRSINVLPGSAFGLQVALQSCILLDCEKIQVLG